MKRRWFAVDFVVVLVFVAIGRSTHHHGDALGGLLSTTWPFALGLALGWASLLRRRRDGSTPASGVEVALATVIVGMIVRVLAGQGTAVAFILVALVFLGGLMVGLRVSARRAARRGGRI